jgi:hypothetical protein
MFAEALPGFWREKICKVSHSTVEKVTAVVPRLFAAQSILESILPEGRTKQRGRH